MAAGLPAVAAVLGVPKLAELVKGTLGSVVEFEPLRAWLLSVAEDAIPGVLKTYLTFSIAARADAATQYARAMVSAQERLRGNLAPLGALALSELFGLPVGVADLAGPSGGPAHKGLAVRLHDVLFAGLFGDLGKAGGITPERGYASMLQLVDALMLFGVESWLTDNLGLGILSKDLPEVGQLAERIARKVGMGRIGARALRPIIDGFILQPAREQIARTYTPAVPAAREAVRMFNRAAITDEEFFSYMARLGWSRQIAAETILTESAHPDRSDLRALLELDQVDDSAVVKYLLAQGFTEDGAAKVSSVIRNSKVRSLREAIATTARAMYSKRELDAAGLAGLLKSAGYSPTEAEWMTSLADLERSRPTILTKAEAEEAYVLDHYSAEELQSYYELGGYTAHDVDVLMAIAVERKHQAEQKAAKAAAKLAPDSLGAIGRSVAEEAYRRGLITRDVLQGVLQQLGETGPALETALSLADARRQQYLEAVRKHQAPAASHALSSGTVDQAYKRGLVDRTYLAETLIAQGFTEPALSVLLALRDAERADYQARKAAAAAKAAGRPKAAAPAAGP